MASGSHLLWALRLTGVTAREKLALIFMTDGGADDRAQGCTFAMDSMRLARKCCLTPEEMDDVLAQLLGRGLVHLIVPGLYRVMTDVYPEPVTPTPQQRERGKSLGMRARARVYARCKNRCAWCEATQELELDHIVPVAAGGRTVESNMQVLCSFCNRFKGARPNEAARAQRMVQLGREEVGA